MEAGSTSVSARLTDPATRERSAPAPSRGKAGSQNTGCGSCCQHRNLGAEKRAASLLHVAEHYGIELQIF